jgi:phosphopantothenate synthetase
MDGNTAAIVGQAITFVSVLVGFGYQFLRDERRHRWAIDARDEAAAQLRLAAAASVKATQSAAAAALTTATAARLALAKNTDISVLAFHEANTVNAKLHELGLTQQAQTAELLRVATAKIATDLQTATAQIASDLVDHTPPLEPAADESAGTRSHPPVVPRS